MISAFNAFFAPLRILRSRIQSFKPPMEGEAGAQSSSRLYAVRSLYDIVEAGLLTMNAGLQTIQSTLSELTAQKSAEPGKAPPLQGPEDLDTAVSEFANRSARILRFARWETSELGPVLQKLIAAARISSRQVDTDGMGSILPLQLALSFGTLFFQQALRVLVT